jgi:hypothetical protein
VKGPKTNDALFFVFRLVKDVPFLKKLKLALGLLLILQNPLKKLLESQIILRP